MTDRYDLRDKRSRFFTNDLPDTKLENSEIEEILMAMCKAVEKASDMQTVIRDTSGGDLYVGLGGVALAMLESSDVTSEIKKDVHKELLFPTCEPERLRKLASELTLKAMETDLKPGTKTFKRVTLLEGKAGLYALHAVLMHKTGEEKARDQSIKELESLYETDVSKMPEPECDVMFGRAGYVCALLFVAKMTGLLPNMALVKTLLNEIVVEGRRAATDDPVEAKDDGTEGTGKDLGFPLMYTWHDTCYLGAAHGLSGILYCTLCATQVIPPADLDPMVMKEAADCTNALLDTCFDSGNLPAALGSPKDNLISIAHGAPGLILLLCKWHEILSAQGPSGTLGAVQQMATEPSKPPQKKAKRGKGAKSAAQGDAPAASEIEGMPTADDYLQHILRLSDLVYERGLTKKGVGLAYGIAGNGYVFCAIHRACKRAGLNDEAAKQLHRSQRFALFCARKWEEMYNVPDNPMSLYEGLAGAISLWGHLLPTYGEEQAVHVTHRGLPAYEL